MKIAHKPRCKYLQRDLRAEFMEPDYYEILGVEPTTDIAIIKAQYRRLVRENHPDIAVDKATAHAKIQEIIAAWSILSHSHQRAEYDERRRRRAQESAPPAVRSQSARPRRSIPHDAKAEARKRARVRQVMGGGKMRRDDNPRTRLLAMFLEAAQLYNVEGRSEDAVRVYQNILRADPTNAEAAIRIGDIYAEQKRRDVALAMYERAVRLQPANADYRRKYNALRHPEAPPAPTHRGANPWQRNDPERPLSDRIARKSPDVPAARAVFDGELPKEETQNGNSNAAPTPSVMPSAAPETDTTLSVPAEKAPAAAKTEKVSPSILQRFRARLKR